MDRVNFLQITSRIEKVWFCYISETDCIFISSSVLLHHLQVLPPDVEDDPPSYDEAVHDEKPHNTGEEQIRAGR